MISLQTNGKALPSALLTNTAYDVDILIDGRPPIFAEWSVVTGITYVDRGSGSSFRLMVRNAGSYTLEIKALKSSGHGEEAVFTLPVSSRRAVAPSLGVKWSRLQVSPGSTVSATVVYKDPEGTPAINFFWQLYWNNNLLDSGYKNPITVASAQPGLYRVKATATDATGATVTTDSTMRVSGEFEILPAIVPPYGETTFQYLGCLYSDHFTTNEGSSSTLPYDIASFYQEAVLLPGTTHVRFILDEGSVLDDEIVVRTNMGNWTLVGPPSGLSTESLVYDYNLDKPFIPAPADHRLAYALDVLNVHGSTFTASAFRVKVECYYAANPIYEYHRCSYSDYVGGTGERQRRLVAVIENLAVDLDAVYGKHRGGTDSTVVYTTQVPDRLPVYASAQGTPYPQLPNTGFMYTEANLVSIYDPPAGTALPTLMAKGVYGLPGLRPYTFVLSMPGEVPIVQRVRRAYGKLAVYMAGGGVNADTTIRARFKTNTPPGYVDYTVPLSDFYNPDADVFEKIGEVDVDVEDYGFDIGGLAMFLTINE